MTPEEMSRIKTYLENRFKNDGFTVKARKTDDSIEVYLDNEFLGVVYKDVDEGEVSYDMNLAILEVDLAQSA